MTLSPSGMPVALVILAHPTPGSFNHAIARIAEQTLQASGYDVKFHDLYGEDFPAALRAGEMKKDAALDAVVRRHIDELLAAERIVVVHPNWWAGPPAILKGWLDRVLRMGEVYRFGPDGNGNIGPIGLLNAKSALVFTTSNTPIEQEVALYGDPLENFWTRCVWNFCGVGRARRVNYGPVVISTPEQREQWLKQTAELCRAG